MSEIVWQDPPKDPRGAPAGARQHVAFVAALRANPGRWALFSSDAVATVVSNIKQGQLAAFRPAGAFEATYRASADNPRRGAIYARYIGGAS